MAKFLVECPHCQALNSASTFLLAKKVITCEQCKGAIDVKANRFTSRKCASCGNTILYDEAKGKGKCPYCHKKFAIGEGKLASFPCPQCGCVMQLDRETPEADCPVCGLHIADVPAQIAKARLVQVNGVSVIKYEGDNTTLVWKHPIEDFNLGSQLIVHESQEALFYLNGQALDLFGPGRYTLETENIPMLRRVYALPTGGQSPFHAEVYFINKTVHMDMKWGTDARVRFIDPLTGIPLDIGASGEMKLCAADARRLVVKLVGTTAGLQTRQALQEGGEHGYRALRDFFRGAISSAVKDCLAGTIKEQKINILEIDAHTTELSQALQARIAPIFEDYGLSVPYFFITAISLDNKNIEELTRLSSERYLGVQKQKVEQQVLEAEMEKKLVEEAARAKIKLLQAQAEAEAQKAQGFAEADVMRAKGYSQKDVLQSEVQKAYAEGIGQMGSHAGSGGSGGGNLTADLVGMMAGLKVAGSVVDRMDGVFSPAASGAPASQQAERWTCSCGETENTKKFCMNCGKPRPQGWDCPACGAKGNTGKFCAECGKAKPESWDCPACGAKGNKGKFCAECGKAREV